MIVQGYLVYLAVTLTVTIWVAHTLHRNGRIFLVEAFHGNDALADSVNHLLVVGFYLVNIGYVAIALRTTEKPRDLAAAIELLSHKIGIVLLVLGLMHFINLKIFSAIRQRSQKIVPPPPVVPSERTAVVNG